MTLLMVAVGAAVGAPARYLIDRAVQSRHRSVLPLGTMAVNVTGSLILGVMTGAGLAASSPFAALLGTGLCGAFTTYSAFSFETWRLIEEESYVSAIANVVISVGVGLGAVFLGYAAAVALAL